MLVIGFAPDFHCWHGDIQGRASSGDPSFELQHGTNSIGRDVAVELDLGIMQTATGILYLWL